MRKTNSDYLSKAGKHLDAFYTGIAFLGFFSSLVAVARFIIHPWDMILTIIALLLFAGFSTVPFITYARFKGVSREFFAKQKETMIKEKMAAHDKKLNLRIFLTGLWILFIGIMNLSLQPVFRSIMLIFCVVLLPCNFLWGTEDYRMYYQLTKEEENEDEKVC